MFNLLRYFSFTSAFVLLVMSVAAAYLYRQNAISELVEHVENQNVVLARSFANAIWPEFSAYVGAAPGLDGDALRARPETREIHEKLQELSSGLPVLKVKMYHPGGLTVFSSEAAQMGADKSGNSAFMSTVRNGMPASKLSFRETFPSFDGVVEDRSLVESYLPIMQGDGPVEGVFELYSDVTPLMANIEMTTTKILVGLVLAFAALYLILFFIVRHANRILKKQYIDLKDNVALLDLFQSIAVAVNEAKTPEKAIPICLDLVCAHTGFQIGHILVPTVDSDNEFKSGGIWQLSEPERFEPFRSTTESTRFKSGAFWIGNVYANGIPAWLDEPFIDQNFLRSEVAAEIGIRSGYAQPVLAGKDVVAVLEFYSTEKRKDGGSIAAVMNHVGTQLGRSFERKASQEKILAAKVEAERADRMKSDFLATMSHEIRTPMNGVTGMAELLLDTPLDEEQGQYAMAVQNSAQALLTIINDILDFSKLETGKFELELIDFNLVEVIEGVVELLGPQATEQGLDLVTFVAPDMPEFLNGDPGRLRQILLNLVGNAIKFTDTGSVAITASFVAVEDGKALLRFEVTDTGIGIPEEAQTKLFEKFTQADSSTTRRYGGTGLGLAICSQLVALMDGEIGVKSRPTKGNTFFFTGRFGEVSGSFGQNAAPIEELSALRVLVVDDIQLNRTIFEKQLASWGIDGAFAADGEAALSAMREALESGRSFDAAIVDHAMPKMDGEELARKIKQTPELAPTKLILANSLNLREDLDRLRRIGFQDCLCKPVRQSALFHALLNVRGTGGEVGTKPSGEIGRKTPTDGVETQPTRRLEILLAEDNRTNQLLAKATLEKRGHRVGIANNGLEAVEAVRRASYDLVLMDVNMPEMDGVQATARIRELGGEKGRIPIIALTANAMKGDREKFLVAGMNDYLSKPLDRKKLVAAVNVWGGGGDEIDRAPASDPVAVDEAVKILDPRMLKDWQAFLPKDQFATLVKDQVSDSRACVQRLMEAVEAGAFDDVGELAHDLKGSCGAIGMLEVQYLAKDLEHACLEKRQEEALTLAPAIDEAVGRAVAALKARYAM
jgi:signal transduction histidine kinase/DNA-binding response OmpR family regulator/HPt (histidine-containing phosphotransfer) domain-containing protein